MATWLKLIGSAKTPLTGAPFHGSYTDEEVGFRKDARPGIRAGDHLFLYAPGGSRRIFAFAEAISNPERNPKFDPKVEGSCRWTIRVRYSINLPVESGILINHVASRRKLILSLQRASHIRLRPDESASALQKLEEGNQGE